eukprot:1188853-Prorocentrum_minimum.AAC.3
MSGACVENCVLRVRGSGAYLHAHVGVARVAQAGGVIGAMHGVHVHECEPRLIPLGPLQHHVVELGHLVARHAVRLRHLTHGYVRPKSSTCLPSLPANG